MTQLQPAATRRRLAKAAALAALCATAPLVQAQEFSRYLLCAGSFEADGKKEAAHADLALRLNSREALIQRSNLLPTGERLQFTASPIAYSMTYLLRPRGTQIVVVPGWVENTVLVGHPNLKRMNQIRLSIDRQNGQMEGVVLNEEDQKLASFRMNYQSRSEAELPAPKY
jgi:hypothetical protein